MRLESGRCLVAWARPSLLEGIEPFLDDVERARLATLRQPSDQLRYVTAHALLREVVAAVRDVAASAVAFDRTCHGCGAQHGRPVTPGLHVSLAHAGDRVVVACTDTAEVGVDVEPADVRVPAGSARTPAEWTAKEAALKAWGVGLAVAPEQVTVAEARALGPEGRRASFTSVDLGAGYVATVAVAADVVPPVAVIEAASWLAARVGASRPATA